MKHSHKALAWISLVLVLSISVFLLADSSHAANIVGTNNRNVTVHTAVNISNAKPELLTVIVYQDTNASIKNITLTAGSTRVVTCNATMRDWNGYSDIINVNATLWNMGNSTLESADDNTNHYSNANCTNAGNGVNFTVGYTCNFTVYYYANNGTWNCSVLAIDTYNKTSNMTNTTNIYALYALNVTDGLDYGNVAVEDYSLTQQANVTNFGNMAINISVEGYGVTRGDGLAMNCSINGNITVANERFSTADVAWGSKVPLTNSSQLISGLTMPKQMNNTQIMNITYWQLYIPPNPAGNCSGYVLFTAQTP